MHRGSELVDDGDVSAGFYELLEGVELRVEPISLSGCAVWLTISQTSGSYGARDGLVVVESDRSISLTRKATRGSDCMLKSIAWPVLTQIIGLRPDLVHDEARWEAFPAS